MGKKFVAGEASCASDCSVPRRHSSSAPQHRPTPTSPNTLQVREAYPHSSSFLHNKHFFLLKANLVPFITLIISFVSPSVRLNSTMGVSSHRTQLTPQLRANSTLSSHRKWLPHKALLEPTELLKHHIQVVRLEDSLLILVDRHRLGSLHIRVDRQLDNSRHM